MLSKEQYREIKIFDLFSSFYARAQRINAQVNFSTINLNIYKDGKYLICNFVLIEQMVINRKTIGYIDVSCPNVKMKIYLTEEFEWVINIENRILKKFTSSEMDYIFYKCYGTL